MQLVFGLQRLLDVFDLNNLPRYILLDNGQTKGL